MTRPVLVKSLQNNLRRIKFIMVKKHKSGNVNNKFAGIGLVALGLFFFVAGLSNVGTGYGVGITITCLLYTSPSPRDRISSRMPSSA